jgi:N-acyl-D-amino-acid deacylase
MLRLFTQLILFIIIVPLKGNGQGVQGTVFDVIIKNGTVYDGSGSEPKRVDMGIKGDRITSIGKLDSNKATSVVDASGLAVAPGFINMLSQSWGSLLVDGRSQGEIRQGVTTQIMGEGNSMGPLTEEMKQRIVDRQGDIKFDIVWTTLAEYLKYVETRGVSQVD